MVLGFLDQLHIFSQLHLIGLLGLLRGLGPLELIALDIFTPFDRVLDTGLIHKLRSYGISGRIFGLFLLFSGIDGFEWFWMGILHKSNQLMLEFLKASFLVLHFSYYTLMAFLMILSVILLSMEGFFQALCHTTAFVLQIEFAKGRRPFLMSKT